MKFLMRFHDAVGNSPPAKGIKKFYQTLIYISGAAIVLAMLSIVLMRYIFQTDLFGMEEIILAVTLWFYFLGSANGSMEDSQIRADIVAVSVKNERIRWRLRLLTRGIELVVLIFFIILTAQLLVINSIRFPTTQGLKIPLIVPQAAILVGFVMMFFYSVGHLIADLYSKPSR